MLVDIMGYTKLFQEIVYSTIWQLPDPVRLVWITMLALKDENHEVRVSVPGLADAAKVSLQDCEKALKILMEPDQYSRTKDYGGRRIAETDGGFCVLNGEKFRKQISKEERREYQKNWLKKKREANRQASTVDDEIDTTEHNRTEHNRTIGIYTSGFLSFWEEYPKKVGKSYCFRIWQKKGLSTSIEEILAAVKTQKETAQWEEEGGKFIPNPATWLNQGRWEDEVEKKGDWFK